MYEAHKQIISLWSEPTFPCDIKGGEPRGIVTSGTGRFDKCVDAIKIFFDRAERSGLGGLKEFERPEPRSSNMKLYAIDNFGKMASILEAFDRHRNGKSSSLSEPESTILNPSWKRYEDLAQGLCASRWDATVSNLVNYWGRGNEKKLRHSCFGSAYMMTMMRRLYKFNERTSYQVILANTINGFDANWAMGAMYSILNGGLF